MSGSFRGVSSSQDGRFGDKEKKVCAAAFNSPRTFIQLFLTLARFIHTLLILSRAQLLKTMKFPDHFSTKVDFSKVKMEAMMPWISTEVAKYLGFEDEVVIGYIESQLQQTQVDPKKMQIALTGFLEKNTAAFVRDLWMLLISAAQNETGIPTSFLEKKKEELRAKKEEQAKLEAALNSAPSMSSSLAERQQVPAAAPRPPPPPAAAAATTTAAAAPAEAAADAPASNNECCRRPAR